MPFPVRPSMRLSMQGPGLLEIFIRTGIYKIPFFRQGGGCALKLVALCNYLAGAARVATTLRGEGYREATHPNHHPAW